MKHFLAVVVALILAITSYSQKGLLKYDSLFILKEGGYAEVIIKNRTKDTTGGFLFNKGNGVTEFRKVLKKLNDSTYLVGLDTLKMKQSSSTSILMKYGIEDVLLSQDRYVNGQGLFGFHKDSLSFFSLGFDPNNGLNIYDALTNTDLIKLSTASGNQYFTPNGQGWLTLKNGNIELRNPFGLFTSMLSLDLTGEVANGYHLFAAEIGVGQYTINANAVSRTLSLFSTKQLKIQSDSIMRIIMGSTSNPLLFENLPTSDTATYLMGITTGGRSVLQNKSAFSARGNSGYAQFNYSGSFAGTGRIFYDSTNGRIGFGTTTPGYKYHFYDNATSATNIAFTLGNAGSIKIFTTAPGYEAYFLKMEHGANVFQQYFYGTNATYILGSAGGDMHIQASYGKSIYLSPDLGTVIAEVSATGSGKKNFAITGSTLLNGAVYTKSNTASDANYTVQTQDYEIVLSEITTGRTLTMPSASTNNGRMLMIVNNNTSGNNWTSSINLVTKTGSTITTIANQTIYLLRSDGANWNIRLIY